MCKSSQVCSSISCPSFVNAWLSNLWTPNSMGLQHGRMEGREILSWSPKSVGQSQPAPNLHNRGQTTSTIPYQRRVLWKRRSELCLFASRPYHPFLSVDKSLSFSSTSSTTSWLPCWYTCGCCAVPLSCQCRSKTSHHFAATSLWHQIFSWPVTWQRSRISCKLAAG